MATSSYSISCKVVARTGYTGPWEVGSTLVGLDRIITIDTWVVHIPSYLDIARTSSVNTLATDQCSSCFTFIATSWSHTVTNH
jgi:hypothetical protein